MAEGTAIGHTAVRVKDIIGMIKLFEGLLGLNVRSERGDGATSSRPRTISGNLTRSTALWISGCSC